MLTVHQVQKIRSMIKLAKNPLFFYDDDPDGVCSFLLLYKINREGHSTIVKTKPLIDTSFLRKVEEYCPDLIIILDVPIVEQNFLDNVKVPVIWIDHHQPLERTKVSYFNPRIKDLHAYVPTTCMAYQVNKRKEDLWIAMAGCISDYYLPDFTDKFVKQYPDLLKPCQDIEQARYDNKVGELPRIISFLLKGRTSEVRKCVNILTRIQSPYEILNGETSQAKYLIKKYQKMNAPYQKLLEKAKKIKPKDNLLIFTYTDNQYSFTSELATELTYYFPDNIVIVAREKSGEMKCSLRGKNPPILPALTEALTGIYGYGGGHEVACGAVIKIEDWEIFLKRFKEELMKEK